MLNSKITIGIRTYNVYAYIEECLEMIDFKKIDVIKSDFKQNVQKYSFDYFLNINKTIQKIELNELN